MENNESTKKNTKVPKSILLLSIIIILFFIVLVSFYFITQSSSKSHKYQIPSTAQEILPDINVKYISSDYAPKINFYAYSDNAATEFYAFIYLITSIDIDTCNFSIYTTSGNASFTMDDLNASNDATDIPFPKSWMDFYNDNDFASGHTNINSFISKSDSDQIIQNIDKFITDNGLNKTISTSNEADTQNELNEADSEYPSSEELLDTFKYTYDENNYFSIELKKENSSGKLTVYAYCTYSEDNISLMQNDFIQIWMYPYSNSIDIGIISNTGDTFYNYIYSDGTLLTNTFPHDSSEDVPDIYMKQFKEMCTELLDFYERYGIADNPNNQ